MSSSLRSKYPLIFLLLFVYNLVIGQLRLRCLAMLTTLDAKSFHQTGRRHVHQVHRHDERRHVHLSKTEELAQALAERDRKDVHESLKLDGRQSGAHLTILPLGDSITFGWWSSTLNGYRYPLQQLLISAGYDVTYTGKVHSGSMANNNCEGYPGRRTLEVMNLGLSTLQPGNNLPDVVLIHVGSNDALQSHDPNTMVNDLATLVDKIHQLAPNTVMIVAQIITNRDQTVADTIAKYNGFIPYLLDGRASSGYKILGVNMDNILAQDFRDQSHPTDNGFAKMV